MIAPDVPIYLRKRYYVMMMLLIGEILIYMAKMNLSICLIDMTSPKTITIGNTTYIQVSEFLEEKKLTFLERATMDWSLF